MWLVERWRWFVYTPAATRDLVMAVSCEHRGLRRERERRRRGVESKRELGPGAGYLREGAVSRARRHVKTRVTRRGDVCGTGG